MPHTFPTDCWFLTGPTACGKSEVALLLAERLHEQSRVEIVAMDSMTLYRGLDIGSAKPSAADQQRVPHHLLDVLDPTESASVDWYLKQAKRVSAEIFSRGGRPLFVGGTPLYLKACLRGLFVGPPADMELRQRLETEAEQRGSESLHRRLAQVDPKAAGRIHTGDVRRIVRALEVFEHTGLPISEHQQQFDRPADPAPRVACIVRPRAELYDRINRRVLAMFDAGWLDEARALLEQTPPLSREAAQAVGLGEIERFLRGEADFATTVNLIQTRTRQFSKRQMTWFRHIEECRFFETDDSQPTEALVDRLMEYFR